MSQSYQKPCRDCKQEITMMEMNGKWAAYNLDGSFHKCKSIVAVALEPQQKEATKQQTLTLEMMDIRLKRVEKKLFNGGI